MAIFARCRAAASGVILRSMTMRKMQCDRLLRAFMDVPATCRFSSPRTRHSHASSVDVMTTSCSPPMTAPLMGSSAMIFMSPLCAGLPSASVWSRSMICSL